MLGRCSAKLPVFVAPPDLPNEALCYPFAIECALREDFPGIRMAALEWRGKRCLAVGADESNAIRDAATELGIQHCVFLKSLPLDRRHNAKIDYPTLKAMIEATTPDA